MSSDFTTDLIFGSSNPSSSFEPLSTTTALTEGTHWETGDAFVEVRVRSKRPLTSKSAFVKKLAKKKRCFICIHLSRGIKRVCYGDLFFLHFLLCKQQHQRSFSPPTAQK